MDREAFEKILSARPIPEVVQELLFEGIPYCFKDTPDLYKDFRKEICDKFQIHPQNFTVIGSAKIGFSLKPKYYGRPFSEESDIDVVLVSDDLFQQLWIQLIKFKKTTVFQLNYYQREKFKELQSILFYGSIRLDMVTDDFPFAKDWWEFFNKLSTDKRFGPRRIRAMIFKSWQHVSIYYEDGVAKLKEI